MLTLCVKVDTSRGALRGGDTEQRGYVAVWASWGDTQRDAVCYALPAEVDAPVTIGAVALPPLDQIRGDETLWLKQYALTRKSGIPAIDAKESASVIRDQAAGTCALFLAELLAVSGGKAPVVDAILQQTLAMQNLAATGNSETAIEQATRASEKGVLLYETQWRGLVDTARRKYSKKLALAQARKDGPLMYMTPRMVQTMLAIRDRVMQSHAVHYFASDGGGAPLWPINPRETSLDGLHLFGYQSDQGWLPAAYYTGASRAPARR